MVKKFHQEMTPDEVKRLYSRMNPSPLKFANLPSHEVSETYNAQSRTLKEKIERLRQRKLGRPLTPAHRQKLVDAGRGRVQTQEIRRKISAATKGRSVSPQTREKIRKARLGKSLSDETKEKIRKANLGKSVSSATRKRLSAALKGHSVSPETREKIIEAAKKMTGRKNPFFWETPH